MMAFPETHLPYIAEPRRRARASMSFPR